MNVRYGRTENERSGVGYWISWAHNTLIGGVGGYSSIYLVMFWMAGTRSGLGYVVMWAHNTIIVGGEYNSSDY